MGSSFLSDMALGRGSLPKPWRRILVRWLYVRQWHTGLEVEWRPPEGMEVTCTHLSPDWDLMSSRSAQRANGILGSSYNNRAININIALSLHASMDRIRDYMITT